jgi:hypothetical protein
MFYKGALKKVENKQISAVPAFQVGDVRKKNIDFLPDVT